MWGKLIFCLLTKHNTLFFSFVFSQPRFLHLLSSLFLHFLNFPPHTLLLIPLSVTLFQILLALNQYPHFNKVTSVIHSSSRIKTHSSTTLWSNFLTVVLISDSMILIKNQDPVHFGSTNDMQRWWGSIGNENSC